MPEITSCPLCAVNYVAPEQVAYHLRESHRWPAALAIEWFTRYVQNEEAAA